MTLVCNTYGCWKVAVAIIAWPSFDSRTMAVAPFCETHAKEVQVEMSGRPAAGPALSAEAQKIEGIRS